MATKKVKNMLKSLPSVPLSNIVQFQQESFKKTTSEKMRKLKISLLENGIFLPFYVWADGNKLLDGHHRLRALQELAENGNKIDSVPIVEIPAATEKEAAEKLLIINSKYAEITKKGLFDFVDLFGVDMDKIIQSVELDGLDLGMDFLNSDDDEIEKGLDISDEFSSDNLEQRNEHVLFSSGNQFDIPDLKEDMIYDGHIDDVCAGSVDTLEDDKRYLVLYGQTKLDDKAYDNVIGFFVDDHRFEKVWNDAVSVIDKFDALKPAAICAPNFSLWADEPLPFQMMSWYKTQWCARYWQEAGHMVIPTLNWSTKRSFEFSFLGLPKSMPTAIIQTRNVRKEKEKQSFIKGLNYAIENFKIGKLYVYGGENLADILALYTKKQKMQLIKPWTKKKVEIDKKK